MNTWEHGAAGHWHPCAAEGCTEDSHKTPMENHRFERSAIADPTADTIKYICSVCGAEKIVTVTAVTLLSQPKLQYTDGDTLDLSGLKIQVALSEGDPLVLGYDDPGVSCSMANGAALSISDSGKTVAVSCYGETLSTEALRVEPLIKNIGTDSTVGAVKTGDEAPVLLALYVLISGTALAALIIKRISLR